MQTAIITYPKHFFVTQLTINSIRKYYPESDITIFVDDIGDPADYISGCELLYKEKIIPFSSLRDIEKIEKGWVRQQIIKLSIDQFVDGDEIFVVDGDTIFDARVDIRVQPGELFDQFPGGDDFLAEQSLLYNKYVKTMFGTDQGHINIGNSYLRTFFPPWRLLRKIDLIEIRNLLGNLIERHNQYIIKNEYQSVSEWELIEYYRTNIAKDTWPLSEVGNGNHTFSLDRTSFRTVSNSDIELGKMWLQYQGCKILNHFWDKW